MGTAAKRADSVVVPVGAEVDIHVLPLTALVARLSHRVVSEIAAVYAGKHIDAQPLDASLFILLSRGGARLTALADRLNTTKQALTFVVGRLERDGYVVRVSDPIDKRAKLIELTEAGRAAAAATDAALRKIERRWRSIAGDTWPHVRSVLADIASDQRSTRSVERWTQ